MLIVLRIYDFTKSWFYYPKMIRYLKKLGIEDEPYTRFKYALWHCRAGKLSDIGFEKCNTRVSDISDGWQRIYDKNPIENK